MEIEQAVLDTLPQPLAVLHFPSEKDVEAADGTVFYILGTAHVSRASCDDAARLIQTIKPDVVMLVS